MITLDSLKYRVCDGVYEPAEDTFLLAHIISGVGDVLEIGTGTGVLSIACALNGSNVTAVDISQKAVACAESNADMNAVKLNVFQSDLFEHVTGRFDEIIFNPPYLPTADSIEGSEQWDGGPDGFSVTVPFLSAAPEFLKEEGRIRIILSDLTDMKALMGRFSNLEFKEEKNEKFDFETIYAYTITAVN